LAIKDVCKCLFFPAMKEDLRGWVTEDESLRFLEGIDI
jgi:hypothetical protein